MKCTKIPFTRARLIINHGHARNVDACKSSRFKNQSTDSTGGGRSEDFFLYNGNALNSKTLVSRQSGSVVSLSS